MNAFVGVDGGATHATALVTDAGGRILGHARADAIVLRGSDHGATIEAIAVLVERVLEIAGTEPPAASLCCGLTGAGRAEECDAIEAALRSAGSAVAVHITTDAEVAFADAFDDGAGLLLIAGTGSIAWGRGPTGTLARSGGWGVIAGDEGSAWAIGQAALRAVLAAYDGRAEPTSMTDPVLAAAGLTEAAQLVRWAERAGKKGVAALAPLVLDAASSDPVAGAIADHAASDLACHLEALARRLGPWPSAVPVAFAGGLLATGRPLRHAVQQRVQSTLPAAAFYEQDVDGARGAARLARRTRRP